MRVLPSDADIAAFSAPACGFNVRRPGLHRIPYAAVAAVLIGVFVPLHAAWADDSIDPTLIPNGSYPARVDKVLNAQHIAVTMQGILKVFLASGRANVTFTDKLKASDDIVVTLTDGKVTEFTKK